MLLPPDLETGATPNKKITVVSFLADTLCPTLCMPEIRNMEVQCIGP